MQTRRRMCTLPALTCSFALSMWQLDECANSPFHAVTPAVSVACSVSTMIVLFAAWDFSLSANFSRNNLRCSTAWREVSSVDHHTRVLHHLNIRHERDNQPDAGA